MKIIDKYNNLSLKGKNVFWMTCIGVAGVIILSPFCFLSFPGLSIGFALGTIIEIGCYLLLCLTSETITKSVNGNAKTGLIVLSTFGFFIRFLIYAAGLVLGAFATFVWETNWLSIWTIFAGYMPMVIILVITTLKNNNKNKGTIRGE